MRRRAFITLLGGARPRGRWRRGRSNPTGCTGILTAVVPWPSRSSVTGAPPPHRDSSQQEMPRRRGA
jgi:hypothetical protein